MWIIYRRKRAHSDPWKCGAVDASCFRKVAGEPHYVEEGSLMFLRYLNEAR